MWEEKTANPATNPYPETEQIAEAPAEVRKRVADLLAAAEHGADIDNGVMTDTRKWIKQLQSYRQELGNERDRLKRQLDMVMGELERTVSVQKSLDSAMNQPMPKSTEGY